MKCVSLLRGINMVGHRTMKMADLKQLYEDCGCKNVETYIQSGNVVFDTRKKDLVKLAKDISKKIEKQFGYDVPVVNYTPNEWQQILDNSPYDDGKHDTKTLYYVMMLDDPNPEKLEAMDYRELKGDHFDIIDRVIYLYVPNSYGKTKLNNNYFEAKLKVHATTRNWNTMQKLNKMVGNQ